MDCYTRRDRELPSAIWRSLAGCASCALGLVILLGSSACSATVTPLELANIATWTGSDDKVNNRLLFLQSLDDDDNPANGIRIIGIDVASFNQIPVFLLLS